VELPSFRLPYDPTDSNNLNIMEVVAVNNREQKKETK
jgi:hypothetical protein